VIFNINFKTLSSLIKSAFVGVWTVQISRCMVQQLKKEGSLEDSRLLEEDVAVLRE